MYFDYSIVKIINNGTQVYCEFRASTGNQEEQLITGVLGDEIQLVWVVNEELGNQTIVFDKCPVELEEIRVSIQNILSLQTGLQWIGTA